MADANLYDDTSLPAETEANAKSAFNKFFESRLGACFVLLIVGCVIYASYLIVGSSYTEESDNYHIISHIAFAVMFAFGFFFVFSVAKSILSGNGMTEEERQQDLEFFRKLFGEKGAKFAELLTDCSLSISAICLFFFLTSPFTESAALFDNVLFIMVSVVFGAFFLKSVTDFAREIRK